MLTKQKDDQTAAIVAGSIGGLAIAGSAGYLTKKYGSILGQIFKRPNIPQTNLWELPPQMAADPEFIKRVELLSGMPAHKVPPNILENEFSLWKLMNVD